MQPLTALCLGAHRSCACSEAASHGRFPPGFQSRFVFPMAATRRGAGRHHHCHRVFCCVLRFFQLVKRPFIPGCPFDSLRGLAIRRRLCEQRLFPKERPLSEGATGGAPRLVALYLVERRHDVKLRLTKPDCCTAQCEPPHQPVCV